MKKKIHGQEFKPGKPDIKAKMAKRLQSVQTKRKAQAIEDAEVVGEEAAPKKGPMVEPAKPPSVFKMIKSFGKDLSAYVKAGAPNCSESDYKDRLLTCEACPHLLRNMMRCGKCGCLVEHKAKWKTTKCPEDKWKAQDLSDLPKPKPKPDAK